MRITTKGRYALRAAIALAKMNKQGSFVSISSIAESEEISSIFLEQIFVKLRKAGIVKSMRGPGGGFSFILPLEKLTIKNILDAAGEDLSLSFCDKSMHNCGRVSQCLAHLVMEDVCNIVNKTLSEITLASLLERKIDLKSARSVSGLAQYDKKNAKKR